MFKSLLRPKPTNQSPSENQSINQTINQRTSSPSSQSVSQSVNQSPYDQSRDIPAFQYAPNPRSIVSNLPSYQSNPAINQSANQSTNQSTNSAPQVTYYPAYHSVVSPVTQSPSYSAHQNLVSPLTQQSAYPSINQSTSPSTSPPATQSTNHPITSSVQHRDPEYEEKRRLRAIRAQIEEEKAQMRQDAIDKSASQSTNQLRQRVKPLGPGFSLNSKPPSKQTTEESSSQSIKTRQLLTDQFVINEKFPEKRFIRHLVRPCDDLVDLAVRYRCSVSEIRQFNRRVVFEYLDNVMGEYIHIPIPDDFVFPRVDPNEKPGDERDLEVPGAGGFTLGELQLQAEINRQYYSERAFISQAEKLSSNLAINQSVHENEARFYLSEANWDVRQALADFAEDLKFEQETEDVKRQREEARKKGTNASIKPSMALAIAEARQARLSSMVTNVESRHTKQKFEDRMRRKAQALLQNDKNVPLLTGENRSD